MLNAQKSMDRKTVFDFKIECNCNCVVHRPNGIYSLGFPQNTLNVNVCNKCIVVRWLCCSCSNTYCPYKINVSCLCSCKSKHVISHEINWRICYAKYTLQITEKKCGFHWNVMIFIKSCSLLSSILLMCECFSFIFAIIFMNFAEKRRS